MFLATSDVRSVLTAVPPDNIARRAGPLRILVVASQPSGAAPLSIAQEEALVRRSFEPLTKSGAVVVDVLARATPEAMQAWVRQRSYDVLHFIGHGEFRKEDDTGFLLFEDEQGNAHRVATIDLQNILRSRDLKLVFLNACETGRGGRSDYNSGVAPGLVQSGIPAVVANQYSVLDRSATTFSQHLYWGLAQGLSLGDAMREARIALNFSGGELIDWAVPVLFARNANARLCESTVRVDGPPAVMPIATGSTVARGRRRRGLQRGPLAEPLTVAVWDVSDTNPELQSAVERMNRAQNVIDFHTVNLTAPYGTWTVDVDESKDADERLYLEAERAAKRIRPLLPRIGADFLLCVTDTPMAGSGIFNIYGWWDDEAKPGEEPPSNRIIFFSSWGFDPPLDGITLQQAIANLAVQGLANLLAKPDVDDERDEAVFAFNEHRSIEALTAHKRFDAAARKSVESTLPRDWSPADRSAFVDALQAVLDTFHPESPAQPAGASKPARRSRTVQAALRKSRTRSKPAGATTRKQRRPR